VSLQTITQYKNAHTALYGGTGLDRRITEEQAGHAAAWEAARQLKDSEMDIDEDKLAHTLKALARQQADQLLTALGLDYLDAQQVTRHAVAAAAGIAPEFVTA
jgi:NADH:ubiquinone oxidoreductase subunit C